MPESAIAAAIASIQATIPSVAKAETARIEGRGGSYKYRYADLAAVNRVILPMLGAAGVAWLTKPTINESGRFVLAYKLMHTSGEVEQGEYPLPSSGTPQEIGSAITYARRYALLAITGVATDDDDDGASASAAYGRYQQHVREPQTWVDQGEMADPASATQVTTAQHRKMHALWKEVGYHGPENRVTRLDITSKIIGRNVITSANLSEREASILIMAIEERKRQQE